MKNNLPVMLLKDLVLLPYHEVKIDLTNEISKKVINVSNKYYESKLLVVCPINPLEENPDEDDLPKIGVMGAIKSAIELPNKNYRVVIAGLRRVKVYSYINYNEDDEILESITLNIDRKEDEPIELDTYLRKLRDATNVFIENNPNVSNAIHSQIKNVEDLDKLTDIISDFLPLSFDKKISLMLNASPISRAKLLIKDLFVEKAILDLDKKIDKELETNFERSQKDFLLKEKLSIIKRELGEENTKTMDINRYKEILKSSVFPENIYNKIKKEIERYDLTPDASPEIIVIKNYLDFLLSIPWSNKTVDEKNIDKIYKKLNETHYGIEDVKQRILEYIAVKNYSGTSTSPILCLVGPPGTGKTTFARSLSQALKRSFCKISLGGLNDPAELNGHRRTYVGSNPGKIVTALIKAGSCNPVILLDEVDKICKDYKGDPTSILLDILDRSTNNKFVDNYINEEIDLSEVLFILTANDESQIPLVLKDRLEVIRVRGYLTNEKVLLAKNYIIKNVLKNNGINDIKCKIEDEDISYIIENYTKESGVRNLERAIDKIIRKSIVKINGDKVKKLNITKDNIKEYLGVSTVNVCTNEDVEVGVSRALGTLNNEGYLLDVETISYPGKEKIIITGNAKTCLKESALICMSIIKKNLKTFNVDEALVHETFHINISNTSLAKDGPSAGVSILVSMLSYLKNIKVNGLYAFVGEMSLTEKILPVGKIKDKILLAVRNKIKRIYIPETNKDEVDNIGIEYLKDIEIIYVNNFTQIYKDLFE